MGCKRILLKMPTDYSEDELRKAIEKQLGIKEFSYALDKKSLDARKKGNIHWQIWVGVVSEEVKGEAPEVSQELTIPYEKRNKKVLVVGSGPAGFFSAFVLQKAGFQTTIIERGTEVRKRTSGISVFEKTGVFDPISNYTFGEGGAGTFSDGKLTSRSKHIGKEKQFILHSYIEAGAPEEIGHLAHPHLGSDNLKKIIKKLREEFLELGGKILFETLLEDLKIENGVVQEALTTAGPIHADYFIIAPGHSAYETYRMLIHRGINFKTKNFAIGSRVEHPQPMINDAQWGKESLPGVLAAEYRLTSPGDGKLPVYTFCMCPGGIVVPSGSYENTSVVNGMSYYSRRAKFANAGVVAGVHPNELMGKEATPLEALQWLENLEQAFYQYSNGYQVPFCGIQDFINKKEPSQNAEETSYPLGLKPAPLWELLPNEVSNTMREALKGFGRKIRGYEKGNIMGLESKTSAPIQALREENNLCSGFQNLYLVGEGSGYSGGIVSSGADGIKAAMTIVLS